MMPFGTPSRHCLGPPLPIQRTQLRKRIHTTRHAQDSLHTTSSKPTHNPTPSVPIRNGFARTTGPVPAVDHAMLTWSLWAHPTPTQPSIRHKTHHTKRSHPTSRLLHHTGYPSATPRPHSGPRHLGRAVALLPCAVCNPNRGAPCPWPHCANVQALPTSAAPAGLTPTTRQATVLASQRAAQWWLSPGCGCTPSAPLVVAVRRLRLHPQCPAQWWPWPWPCPWPCSSSQPFICTSFSKK